MKIIYREAKATDEAEIALLHAQSWQNHYRGLLEEDFLNEKVIPEKQKEWAGRFAKPEENQKIFVAEAFGEVIGFVCAFANHDSRFGTLIDNLHVKKQGQGIGGKLLDMIAGWSGQAFGQERYYLWVLEGNKNARHFYEKKGGQCVETVKMAKHNALPVAACRYCW